MINFCLVILLNCYRIPYFLMKITKQTANPEKYPIEARYKTVRRIIRIIKRTLVVRTKAYGKENLPTEGGYMLYPNHQGKYDVLGIIHTHDTPCTVVMDIKKSNTILVKQLLDGLSGKRLDKTNPRQAYGIINQITAEVQNGRKYILFPEGGYKFNNKNTLEDFKPGCFKIALKSHAPIVPVALIDSYRVFNSFHIGPVCTQVHYLEPIYYDEYKELNTQQIANLVKQRIQAKIDLQTK